MQNSEPLRGTQNINRDALVEKVNQAIAKAGSKKRMRLQILLRRYLGGERHERLFEAMKIETANE